MDFSSKFLRYMLCFITGISVMLGATAAQAVTYYVSLTGNDANSGTSTGVPFKTFAKAVKPLKPGDTLYIRGGVWTQQLDLQANNNSGTSSAWIKIAGYPGETVTIRYADPLVGGYGPIRARGSRGYLIFENLVLDGVNAAVESAWTIAYGNHNFTLRNVEIKNFKRHGLAIIGNNIQVINCKIHDQVSPSGQPGQRYYGIYWQGGSNGLIQGSHIYNNPGGGVQVFPGPISNLTIRNNAIYSNNKLTSSGVGGLIVQGQSGKMIKNTQIYNNLVYKNGSSSTSGNASGIQISSYTDGTKIWNNTIYGNKIYGLQVGYNTTTTNTKVQNNIMYSNAAGNYINKGAGTTYSNNLTTDPKFVSASSNNFQLQSSSPAANKGVILSGVVNDYKNSPRPKNSIHDIGGYENY